MIETSPMVERLSSSRRGTTNWIMASPGGAVADPSSGLPVLAQLARDF